MAELSRLSDRELMAELQRMDEMINAEKVALVGVKRQMLIRAVREQEKNAAATAAAASEPA